MTSKYANLKPLPSFDPQISGEITVLKWSHSIIEEHNFLNEWEAIEKARSLSLDIETYNVVFYDNEETRKFHTIATSTVSPHKSLGFAPDVDVLIGLEDELVMYHAVVPEISLGHGLMPWRAGLLRGGEYQHQQYTTNEQAEAPYDTRHWQCTAHPLDEAAPHRPLAECEQGSTTAIATFDEEIVVHMGLGWRMTLSSPRPPSVLQSSLHGRENHGLFEHRQFQMTRERLRTLTTFTSWLVGRCDMLLQMKVDHRRLPLPLRRPLPAHGD